MKTDEPLITTISERCRVCYTCVRDCPAKAIRIREGQAQVLNERCIGCGNCVRVCSQQAKRVYDSIPEAQALLKGPDPVAAVLAPSFPAEFTDREYTEVVGMIRQLGFSLVTEVAFGADLVAAAYRRLLENNPDKRFIATTCPAVVAFIEKYHPRLVDHLSPIASPMIAQARVLRALHGPDLKVIFVGPCIAKKVEGDRTCARGIEELDAVLTFAELRRWLEQVAIEPDAALTGDFDPPHPSLGALFPISRGMLQAAGMEEDLLSAEVVAADGRRNFVQAVKEFESGALEVRLLEILSCNGCIMGSGMSVDTPLFRRRSAVSQYVRNRVQQRDEDEWRRSVETLKDLDLAVSFEAQKLVETDPPEEKIREILAQMGKTRPEDELNCQACGYETCREHAIAIYRGLAENEMCLPNTIERLRQSLQELNASNLELASTQQALINAEKLASMGQLAAGIAHEVNNPLGVILLYARLLLKDFPAESEEHEDLGMIAEQAERCKKIVNGLLNFARKNKVVRRKVDMAELLQQCMKGIIVPDNVTIAVNNQLRDPAVELDADQMIQVLTNLITNAMEAMPQGGHIELIVQETGEEIRIRVRDTGTGIAEEYRQKVFEPLFTTKQMGKGTGLGLAVSYGIVKMHRGRIEVESNTDPEQGPTGTTFTVTFPKRSKEA
jgi:signal transduction histidine kinase/Fe-S-cluster-containing hydrogenase component 2